MDYQEDPQREAKPAVAINSQEVPSICDSVDQYIARLERKQTCGGGQAPHQYKHCLLTVITHN